MKYIKLIIIYILACQAIVAAEKSTTSKIYGSKSYMEISGSASASYSSDSFSKNFMVLLYPEFNYFIFDRWYLATLTTIEFFNSNSQNNPYAISNLDIDPLFGIGYSIPLSDSLYLNIPIAFGTQYMYCPSQNCQSGFYNGFKLLIYPSLKFALISNVFLNLTLGLGSNIYLPSSPFDNTWKANLLLGLSYAFY